MENSSSNTETNSLRDPADFVAGIGTKAQTLLVALAAILTYLPTLRFGFVYDDDIQVLDNPAITSWHFLPAYFLKPIAGFYPGLASAHYYRPLFFIWLRLNYFLWHKQAWGWHLTNILLHAAVSILVLLVLRKYFPGSKWALFGALIFAVHPVHAETVAWVSGCTDSLMALGLLGSFYLWLKSGESSSSLLKLGSLLCFLLALLSKETAIVFSAIVFLHALSGFGRRSSDLTKLQTVRSAILQTLPYAALSALYLAARWQILRGLPDEAPWIHVSHALFTVPSLILFYVFHLIWPQSLSFAYDLPVVARVTEPRFWLPVLFLAILFSGFMVWYRKVRNPNILAGMQWFLLPLAPVLYIGVFHRDDFAHDRYLYLPSFALSILIVMLADYVSKLARGLQGQRVAISLAGALIAGLGLFASIQARPWENNLLLYTNAFHMAPQNALARNNLASEYAGRGRYLEAIEILKPLLKEHPDLWLANYNFGYANYKLGNLSLAEEFLQRSIAIDAANADQYVYLGTTYFKQNRLQEAARQIQEGIARRPDQIGYHFALGIVYLKMNQLATAREEMQKELQFHPENSAAREQLKAIDKQMAEFFH
ncbi:MAG: tetratricopeptide repeat protein [Acidobacteria bacterium]|nr:tetratricopeptide repeat protein [Acidobacteriota bacterium]MBS1864283.1 tetratricopeptide repeat protein [Acidobacteriota bacterium]